MLTDIRNIAKRILQAVEGGGIEGSLLVEPFEDLNSFTSFDEKLCEEEERKKLVRLLIRLNFSKFYVY